MRIPNTKTADRRKSDEKRQAVWGVLTKMYKREQRKHCRRSADREVGRTLHALSKMEWQNWDGWTTPSNLVLGEMDKNPVGKYPHPQEGKTVIAILEFDPPSYSHDEEKQYVADLECYGIRIGAVDCCGHWVWHNDLAFSHCDERCKSLTAQWIANETTWRMLPHVPGDPTGEAEAEAVADEAERLAKEKWERDRRIQYPHNLVDSAVQFINHGLKEWLKGHFPKSKAISITPHPTATNKTGIIIKCGGLTHNTVYPGAEIYIADNGLLVVDNKGRKHCPQCGLIITEKASVGFKQNPASKKDPDYCARCKPDKGGDNAKT